MKWLFEHLGQIQDVNLQIGDVLNFLAAFLGGIFAHKAVVGSPSGGPTDSGQSPPSG